MSLTYEQKLLYWEEMCIREISTQSKFACIAFENINPKASAGTDATFSSIHSFLSHCANVSKLLKQTYPLSTDTIATTLELDNKGLLYNKKARNDLEHFDERISVWVAQYDGLVVLDYNIGPKDMIADSPKRSFIRHYDPNNETYTSLDVDYPLREYSNAVTQVKELADTWVVEKQRSNREMLFRPSEQ